MGSSVSTEVSSGDTSFQVAVGGVTESLNVTWRVSVSAWNIARPVFQHRLPRPIGRRSVRPSTLTTNAAQMSRRLRKPPLNAVHGPCESAGHGSTKMAFSPSPSDEAPGTGPAAKSTETSPRKAFGTTSSIGVPARTLMPCLKNRFPPGVRGCEG